MGFKYLSLAHTVSNQSPFQSKYLKVVENCPFCKLIHIPVLCHRSGLKACCQDHWVQVLAVWCYVVAYQA